MKNRTTALGFTAKLKEELLRMLRNLRGGHRLRDALGITADAMEFGVLVAIEKLKEEVTAAQASVPRSEYDAALIRLQNAEQALANRDADHGNKKRLLLVVDNTKNPPSQPQQSTQ